MPLLTGQKRGLRRRKGVFQLARTQEYKLHVSRFSEPLPGLRNVPRLQRHSLARRGPCRKNQRASITEVCQMTVKEGRPFFDSLKLTELEATIAEKILEEIQQRLRFLDEVGLDYLSLDR